MPGAADIDWEEINAKLPYVRNKEEKAKRKDLFMQFDPNGNGYLSLAEVSAPTFHCRFSDERVLAETKPFSTDFDVRQ